MAALQKVRNRGKLIVVIIGLALFGFIIEEGVKAIGARQVVNPENESIIAVGNNSMSHKQFKENLELYPLYAQMRGMQGSEEQLRDQMIMEFEQQALIENECKKLGLRVTDAELQDIIDLGRSQLLQSSPYAMIAGRYDGSFVREFLNNVESALSDPQQEGMVDQQARMLYNFWPFLVKQVRFEALANKYYALLQATTVSNPVAAKATHELGAKQGKIAMAVLPYNSINDNDVTINDDDLKAKYNEVKELFLNAEESRDIKYVKVKVVPSQEDLNNLQAEMNGYAQELATSDAPARIVHESQSTINYFSLPVTKDALPHEVAEMLDTMQVGTQVGPFDHAHDNSINIVRLINKVTLPDSVTVRLIGPNQTDDADSWKLTADSIMTALNSGLDIDSVAKQFNREAQQIELASAMYQKQQMNADTKKYFEVINNAEVGSNNLIEYSNGASVIAHIDKRANFVPKYEVAVIKRVKEFSSETYSNEYNKFNSFLASNRNLDSMIVNGPAKGYIVQTENGVSSRQHSIGGVGNVSSAIRWIFDEAKQGGVSEILECGQQNHMLCIALTNVNEKGYLPLENERVQQTVRALVLNDKKAALLQEKMKAAKNVSDVAAISGAIADTISGISMEYPAFVSTVNAQEPVLSGAVSAAKQGEFKSGIQGNGGVYAFQVLEQASASKPFDEAATMRQLQGREMQKLQSRFLAALINKYTITNEVYKTH